MLPLSINADALRLMCAIGDVSKLAVVHKAAAAKAAGLGLSLADVPKFTAKPDESGDVSFNQRAVLDWINSVSLPIRGDSGYDEKEKLAAVAILKQLVVSLNGRLGTQ